MRRPSWLSISSSLAYLSSRVCLCKGQERARPRHKKRKCGSTIRRIIRFSLTPQNLVQIVDELTVAHLAAVRPRDRCPSHARPDSHKTSHRTYKAVYRDQDHLWRGYVIAIVSAFSLLA